MEAMSATFEAIPDLAASVEVHPVKSFGGTIRLPGSKSLTNRALLVASLASGRSILRNTLDCDDSRYMIGALRALGVDIVDTSTEDGSAVSDGTSGRIISIRGCGGEFSEKRGEFFLGNAGTATRFLTAALTIAGGDYVIDGDERMRQRPIAHLVDALQILGAQVKAPSGCPPVEIGARKMLGGDVNISGTMSSQFISAILMAAPFAQRSVAVRIEGGLVSSPYVGLTLSVMNDFGAKAYLDEKRADGQPVFHVLAGRTYTARDYIVEGDASTAGYFYAAAAVTGGTVRVEGVGKDTVQGDLRCVDVLAEMGCRVKKDGDAVTVTGAGGFLRGVDCDCSDMPDVVPTLAVVGALARGRTRLTGVPHLRHKESDRIASVASELRKIGVKVSEREDGLEISGQQSLESLSGARINSWGDHRLAMAMSVAGLLIPGIVIENPGVVSKSFPGFFHALRTIGCRSTFHGRNGDVLEPASGERAGGSA
jgi:3-phosphoshikimate 1-carboxyvinyltransferase